MKIITAFLLAVSILIGIAVIALAIVGLLVIAELLAEPLREID